MKLSTLTAYLVIYNQAVNRHERMDRATPILVALRGALALDLFAVKIAARLPRN